MFTYLLVGLFIFCWIMLIITAIALPFAFKHDMNMIYHKAYEIKYMDDVSEEEK